ncbi:MAG: flagellar hook-basal body protein [Desulfobacteraceae bacterium]|nr:flagellar hook-basal body protein [Desulfobacteraceae bacterium]
MILEMTRPVQGGLRQERKLETVSNHLANANTTGFKKDVLSFDAQFKAQLNKDFTQGAIVTTGNPLDVALGSEGFFKMETPEGIKYTRNGNFSLDANGILVDMNGNPVMGQAGAIAIEAGDIQQGVFINEGGQILVDNEIVDTFDIVTFADSQKLKKQGQNLYVYDGETMDEIAPETIKVKQRALENSNIKVVDEMVRMIDYNRMFDTFTKAVLSFDEIDSKAISEVGKLL